MILVVAIPENLVNPVHLRACIGGFSCSTPFCSSLNAHSRLEGRERQLEPGGCRRCTGKTSQAIDCESLLFYKNE